MNNGVNGKALARAAMLAAGIGFVAWLSAATPIQALDDTQQLLSGGNSLSENETRFVAPGSAGSYTADSPNTGLGESAAQIRMPAGVLSALRVKLTTATAPSSGTFTLMVRKNGADTVLFCSRTSTGNCIGGAKTITFATNDLLSIRVSNNFVGSGPMGYTYTLVFD